ncbi:MAG: hypothetical protein K2X38_17125 [Gemmataceae bacterium]|nr:hypothetical protein [Gemmataceae bacterium]
MLYVAILTLGFSLTGCGGGSAPLKGTWEEPLTLAQWKKLPPETKFTVETFEKLKAGEPSLQDEKAWSKFARETVNPARKKELQK